MDRVQPQHIIFALRLQWRISGLSAGDNLLPLVALWRYALFNGGAAFSSFHRFSNAGGELLMGSVERIDGSRKNLSLR